MAPPLHTFRRLGPALRLLRETVAALEQEQVAERTGISQRRLSRYEKEKQVPDLPTLAQLLACYGVDLEQFGRTLKQVQNKPEEPD